MTLIVVLTDLGTPELEGMPLVVLGVLDKS